MIDLTKIENIYLVPGYTDMRKQVDGLLSEISVNYPHINLEPNNLYIFCGKDRTKIKVLEIDPYGVWVYYKRTHGDKFLWPRINDTDIIDKRQLSWLLEGLSVLQKHAHKEQYYTY
jgi:transposase